MFRLIQRAITPFGEVGSSPDFRYSVLIHPGNWFTYTLPDAILSSWTALSGIRIVKKIFISYRRLDSSVFTGRLFDRLNEYYGADTVFLDIDSIPGAADFRDVVQQHIRKCGVFLAIIGNKWAGTSQGMRRIDEPGDHVRIEIEQAIAEKKPVIPVYCDETEPLKAGELPASLQPLAFANACPVDPGRDFNHHVLRLRSEINKILFPSRWGLLAHTTARFIRRKRASLGLCLLLAFLVFLGRDLASRALLTRHGLDSAVSDADSATFSKGEQGVYQIVRGLPDRKALVSETDIVSSIRQTTKTFDAFALTGSVFFNNSEAISDGLQHDVQFRILILDHSQANRDNVENYFRHCGLNSNGVDWSETNARLAYSTFRRFRKDAQQSGKGSMEVRWWKGPFLNSFWVRDSSAPANALAHTEITFYGDSSLNPSVRFGRLSPRMITSIQEQFDYLWNKSPAEKDDQ